MAEQARTRDEYKKLKEQETKQNAALHSDPEKKKIRVRLIPIWLRLVLLIVFTFVFLMAGAAVGYGVIGKGKVVDVFKISTWTHIRDLVDKK